MKELLACEGPSEVILIHSLVKYGHFPSLSRFVMGMPLVVRQLTRYIPVINTIPIEEEIYLYRIGDTQKDELSLSGLELRESHIHEERYCTRPEIEILVIINEGLLDQYQKRKSKQSPKSFVKERFKGFHIEEYFEEHDMFDAILEYRRIWKKRKGDLFLADLLDKLS